MTGRAFIVWGLLSLFAAPACNESSQIGPPGPEERQNKPAKKSKDASASKSDIDDAFEDDESELGEIESGSSKKIDYPILDLHGTGSLSCDGDRYDTLSKYKVKIDADNLNVDFYVGKVTSGGSKVEDKANPKIAEKLGPTNYKRVSKSKRSELIKSGFPWAAYAVFSTSATKEKTGEVYQFDPPLPIFPLPARSSAYDELGTMKSWESKVTGGIAGSFTAKMTIEMIDRSDDEVVLKMVLTIPEDSNRAIYEEFPVAKEATYTVNTKAMDVRQAVVVNWYKGDDKCKGKPEDVTQEFNLCSKTVNGKTSAFTCL